MTKSDDSESDMSRGKGILVRKIVNFKMFNNLARYLPKNLFPCIPNNGKWLYKSFFSLGFCVSELVYEYVK